MIIKDIASEEASPLSIEESSRRIDSLGPFEAAPHVAVAVSGGRDSMALCLLVDEWARRNGGRVSAITVDHQLRSESAEEAIQTGKWLSSYGIDHHILRWSDTKPVNGVQAAAREARYALMEDWCRQNGVLHLFLGHHQEDQAETVLFRMGHDSGLDGLAGMSSVRELAFIRLLRPYLDVPRRHLTAYLQSREQAWIEDPSNEDAKYARTRLRDVMQQSDDQSRQEVKQAPSIDDLTKLAMRCARARVTLEQVSARVMAQCCSIDPFGFARLDVEFLRGLPAEISLRVLSRTIRCIGGQLYNPRQSPLERIHRLVIEDQLRRNRTLGGCLLSPQGSEFFVYREHRNLPAPMAMTAEQTVLWDNRFRIRLDRSVIPENRPYWLAALGREGCQQIKPTLSAERERKLPSEALSCLPAIHDRHGLAFVPHLHFVREDLMTAPLTTKNAVFQPPEGLGDCGFVGFMLHEQQDILSL